MARPSSATRLEPSLALAAGALAAAVALAWAGLLAWQPPMGPAGFLAAWTLMMAAMMLPSVAPLVLLHRGSRGLLAVGYLAVWGVLGLVPYAAMEWGLEPALPVVLALAGVYELTPLKSACLSRCRNAASFLVERYRSGPLRLGVEHGIWCAGCCVGLMAVLVLAAAMDLRWAAVVAAAVFVEKVLPRPGTSSRLTGAALLVAAGVVAIV